MCGRYTYFPREFSDLRLTWNVDEVFGLKPRYNIAPTQEAPVIVQAAGKRTLELSRWGLIPWWAKDPAIGNRMINARAETLAEEPAFKKPARKAPLSRFSGRLLRVAQGGKAENSDAHERGMNTSMSG